MIDKSKADRLLTDEEQDACTPTKEQLESYLATPNDKIAESLTETERCLVARCILYGQNIAKAQRDLTAPIMRAKCQERVERVLRETGVELEKWMNEETSPYRRLAQAEHAITRLKRGQALKEQEILE